MFEKKWDYSGEFLNQFVPLARSTVANWFCEEIRRLRLASEPRKNSVGMVLYGVGLKCQTQLAYGRSGRALDDDGLLLLENSLNSPEAENFTEFLLWRESLPQDEREKLRDGIGRVHRDEAMLAEAPTEKQLNYLKALRCPTVPVSKLEASQLIGQYKR